jgi:hypothetical protein
MTLYFFTGFEGCSDIYDVNQLFDDGYGGNFGATGGYNNSKCIYDLGGDGAWGKIIPSGLKTISAGGHFTKIYSNIYTMSAVYYDWIFVFLVGSTSFRLRYTLSNGFSIYQGTTVIHHSGYTVPQGSSCHIEMKLFSDAVSGYIQVKVNGKLIINLTNMDTDGGDITFLYFSSNHSYECRLDNLYIADDFQGELYSQVLYPNADGDINQFIPSTGVDNYAMVDETVIDDDTTYVYSNNVGDKDLYNYQTLTLDGNTIKGISLFTLARKTSGVARSLQHMSKQDSVERYHFLKDLNLDYNASYGNAMMDFFANCPDGTSWTVAKLNAIQWGVTLNA